MAANISTPEKITGDSSIIAPAPTGSESSSGASASQANKSSSEKSGPELPNLEKQIAEGKDSEQSGFTAALNKIVAMANSMFNSGNQTAMDNLTSTEVAKTVSNGGNVNVAEMQNTAQRVGLEAQKQPPQKPLSSLDPALLAAVKGEGASLGTVGAVMAQNHDIQYAGASKPQEAAAAVHVG